MMKWLTRLELMIVCVIVGLLLTGWAVKTYRTAHPPAAGGQPAGN